MKSSKSSFIYLLKSVIHWNNEMVVHRNNQNDSNTEATLQVKQTSILY